MHNSLIFGSGRSGTSMVAQLFRESGCYLGTDLIPATASNKYGYFEDKQINVLNDVIIDRMLRWPILNGLVRKRVASFCHVERRFYWLAGPRRTGPVALPADQLAKLHGFLDQQPFCYKDPRFSVTLPTWQPFLPEDVRYIVVFRDPEKTVDSALRFIREIYDLGYEVPRGPIYKNWQRNYSRLLQLAQGHDRWLFLNYDDVASGEAVPVLEAFVEAELDSSLIDVSASRARANATPSRHAGCRAVYEQLLQRSAGQLKQIAI